LHYVTHAGDTLVTIADRFNVSVEDLRRWNHLSSTAIAANRSLTVAEPARVASSPHVRSSRAHAKTSVHAAASAKTKSEKSVVKPSAKPTASKTTEKKGARTKRANAAK
jgi:membrane-bound lytic murein transglycosylase D